MTESFLGKIGSRLLIPCLRIICRHTEAFRPFLWANFIDSKLAWRDYPFEAKTIFGCKFAGSTNDVIQRYIYYFGVWEPNVSGFITRRLKPGDVMIDVGANIGYMSLLSSTAVGPSGQVVSIEASSRTAQKLQANIARNQIKNIRSVCGAVSDTKRTMTLYFGPDGNCGMTSTVQDFGNQSEQVVGAPLDQWINRQEMEKARLIKIDVEGAEIAVLRSIITMLPQLRRDVEILCEVNPQVVSEDDLNSTITQFAAAGFSVYELPDDSMDNYLRPSTVRPVASRLRGRLERRTEVVLSRTDADSL